MISKEYEANVAEIDNKIGGLLQQNVSDESLMINMIKDMPKIKMLLENLGSDQMDALCNKYSNFFYYMKVLDTLATHLSSGRIKV